jgi:Tol biopolymer transport system component/C-terminal processing protease CtpA/Prc
MFRRRLALSVCLLSGFASTTIPAAPADDESVVATFAEPSVSPDHSEIAFLSGGDVWSAPSTGGTARLLADVGGAAERPLFSPEGNELAFVSTRPGSIGIDTIGLSDGRLRRITYDDVAPDLDGWSRNGKYLYFSTTAKTISATPVIRRVPATGGTPMDVRAEAYVYQMDAAPSPDGSETAYVRNGFEQWWRRGHSHIDEGSITIVRPAAASAAPSFETVTDGTSKDRWPMWSPDGSVLYFVSDRSGTDQLWERRDGKLRALTQLPPGRVLWPTISRDGALIAFERDMAIWTYDTATGATHELSIEPRGLPVTLPVSRENVASFGAFDLSPDGKKLAFIARGRVFAADAQEGGDGQDVPLRDPVAADEPVWAHDSRHAAFVVDNGDTQAIVSYAFPDGPAHTVTPPGHHDDYPHWSPDGTKLEFVRDGTEIHVISASGQNDRVLARGIFDRRPFGDEDDIEFSPDGKWLAYVDNPPGGFSNVYVVPAEGGVSHAITGLPNTNTGPIAWAPDGKRLYAVTSQRTEAGQVAQIDLVPQSPRFQEDTFRNLFQEEPVKPNRAPVAPSPQPSPQETASASPSAEPTGDVRIEFKNIEQRVVLVPTGLDVARLEVTPDSKTLVLVANAAGEQNLYSFSVDETSNDPKVAMQLTNTPTGKARTRIAPDGTSVVYLDGGRLWRVGLDGKGGARPIPLTAAVDVDFERDKRVVFAQAWSTLDRWYADPHFNGIDWPLERRIYEPHALAARTRKEFSRIVNLMIGELDSSHSGFGEPAPPGSPRLTIGALGVDYDPQVYEREGKLRFARLVPYGPLALSERVSTGDELLAVNGVDVDRATDVNALLANTIGKRTILRIAPGGNASAARDVAVLPVDDEDEWDLRYRAWVAGRRAYVDRVSGGKLGYVHLVDMSEEALEKFYLDLDVANREKLGVVIDIRNNEGGFVDPYALDVLSRREFLHFRSRFGYDAPERTSLGQRALDRPTVLVVNEHTLSDGENFTEGYRRLHLGQTVGVPTAGWIIFTSGATLADGSRLRVPFTSVFADDGTNMERHPRRVDVTVDDTPESSLRGDDPQLDAAVRVLLKSTAGHPSS